VVGGAEHAKYAKLEVGGREAFPGEFL